MFSPRSPRFNSPSNIRATSEQHKRNNQQQHCTTFQVARFILGNALNALNGIITSKRQRQQQEAAGVCIIMTIAAAHKPQEEQEGQGGALVLPLGARASVTEAFWRDPARFRLEFTHDLKTKELRWVLFTASRRGCIGKLIFTLEKDATAHVKSIVINKEWRGYGLARILYHACLSTLKELGIQELHLEAEEDTKRHGKLVGLYENWGFHTKPDAKVLFLYNDTECFRKVPMMLPFATRSFFPVQPSVSSTKWFCILTLKTSDGTYLMASEDGAIEARKAEKSNPESLWQTLLGTNGEIFLRSVHGKFLCVEESGNILADRQLNSTWETFQVVPHHSSDSSTPDASLSPSIESTGGIALKNFHGSYLCIDQDEKKVVSSQVPVPWDGGDMMSLVCNKADAKPLFAKIMRKYQTLEFVKQQVLKYSDFQHATLSIADACKLVMRLNGDTDASESWVIKHMLATAEAVREDGHPDWLQLAVFLRALGMLFLCWTDDDNAALRSISAQEWLVKNSTWVLGSTIPESVGFSELNELNSDHCNAAKTNNATTSSQSGMDSATLPWTPDEYLFRVLEFNKSTLPTEALQAIRLWSLKAWHAHDSYDDLCAPQDFETKEWLRSLEMYNSASDAAVKSVVPEKTMPYYLALAEKYLPAELQW